jgi:hypothetical protein
MPNIIRLKTQDEAGKDEGPYNIVSERYVQKDAKFLERLIDTLKREGMRLNFDQTNAVWRFGIDSKQYIVKTNNLRRVNVTEDEFMLLEVVLREACTAYKVDLETGIKLASAVTSSRPKVSDEEKARRREEIKVMREQSLKEDLKRAGEQAAKQKKAEGGADGKNPFLQIFRRLSVSSTSPSATSPKQRSSNRRSSSKDSSPKPPDSKSDKFDI